MTIDQLRKATALIDELDEVIDNSTEASVRIDSIKHHADRLQETLTATLAERERALLLQRFTPATA